MTRGNAPSRTEQLPMFEPAVDSAPVRELIEAAKGVLEHTKFGTYPHLKAQAKERLRKALKAVER